MAKGRTLANAQSVYSRSVNTTETKADLEACVESKMAIVDDFIVGKNKLNKSEKKELKNKMSAIKTTWGIDRYFQEFIFSKM